MLVSLKMVPPWVGHSHLRGVSQKRLAHTAERPATGTLWIATLPIAAQLKHPLRPVAELLRPPLLLAQVKYLVAVNSWLERGEADIDYHLYGLQKSFSIFDLPLKQIKTNTFNTNKQ